MTAVHHVPSCRIRGVKVRDERTFADLTLRRANLNAQRALFEGADGLVLVLGRTAGPRA